MQPMRNTTMRHNLRFPHQHGQAKRLDEADRLGVTLERQAKHAQPVAHERVRACMCSR